MMNHFKAGAAKLGSGFDFYLSAALRSSFFKRNIFDPGNIKIFNRYMFIAILLIASYLALDMFITNPSKTAASLISKLYSIAAGPGQSAEVIIPLEIKSFSNYSGKMPSRNIFVAGPDMPSDLESGAADSAADTVGLVGIIAGNNPQAIIEDKKSQKTYYLIEGQTLNGITLEDISEGGVTLNYKGKKVTLLL